MKNYSKSILGIFILGCFVGILGSCKMNKDEAEPYIKQLVEVAAQLDKNCPKDMPNGTKLESVSFTDNTLTYRLSLSDESIVTIDLDNARDSIIQNLSDKLKKFLVKGDCNIEYKYVSDNDSSSITIVPNELGYTDVEEDK